MFFLAKFLDESDFDYFQIYKSTQLEKVAIYNALLLETAHVVVIFNFEIICFYHSPVTNLFLSFVHISLQTQFLKLPPRSQGWGKERQREREQ